MIYRYDIHITEDIAQNGRELPRITEKDKAMTTAKSAGNFYLNV